MFKNTLCRLHRSWWQILEAEFVDDNYKMLVTILAIWSPTSVIFLHDFYAYVVSTPSGDTNIQKMSPTSKFGQQYSRIDTYITVTLIVSYNLT